MKKILAAGLLLAGAGSAMAELYVGASAGGTRWDIDAEARCPQLGWKCDRNDVGARVYGGVRFNPDWGLEIGAHDFGQAKALGATSGAELGEVRLRGYHILVANRLNAGHPWYLNTRLGVGMNRVEVSAPGLSIQDDEEKAALYFGIGAAWQMSRTIALRLDFDTTRGEYGGEKGRVYLYSAGLELKF